MKSIEDKSLNNLTDTPITDESQDSLHRTLFINSLSKEISNINIEDSFCYGLYGKWGEGKTSVLNLLRNKLKEDRNIILVEFDPWFLASKDAILKSFLECLGKRLILVSGEMKTIFKKYFKRLTSLGITVFGCGINAGWNIDELDPSGFKKKINFLIKKSNKKIVVFIDDIDRLQPDEIIQVFKLVKLIADFKHTVFVLCMDSKIVEKSLKSQNMDVEYIDKIVQKPVALPKIEQDYIDDFLWEELNKLFERLKLEKQRVDKMWESYTFLHRKHSRSLFVTLRSVKRYVNSLSSSISPIVAEVNLFDFVILELIKVFAPYLYDDIYENWWFYVKERYPDEKNHNPLSWQRLKDDQEIEAIKGHVEIILGDQSQKEVFKNLLGSLFPQVNNAFKLYHTFSEGRIARQESHIYSTSFPKYFTLKVPPSELSDELVRQLLLSWKKHSQEGLTETISNTIVHYKEKSMLTKFLAKLAEFVNIITPENKPALIRSLYQNSRLYTKDTEESGRHSEFFEANHLIVDLLSDKLEKKKVQTILEEIMELSTSLDFAYTVFGLCVQESTTIIQEKWQILPIIRKALVDRFKKQFILPQFSFFETKEPSYVLKQLWDFCAEEENVDKKECSCAEYVKNLIARDLRSIGSLLCCFIAKWVGTTTTLELDINEVSKYIDTKELYERIMKENKEVYTTDEEKEYVEIFIRNFKMHEGRDEDSEVV